MYVITNPAWPDYAKVGANCEGPPRIGLRDALLEFEAGLAAPLQAAPVREPPIRHGGSSAFVLGEARGLAIEAPPSPQL